MEMNAREILLLAFLAIIAGALVGAFTGSVALWILATFCAIALLLWIHPWMSRRFRRDGRRMEDQAKSMARELDRTNTAQAYNPEISTGTAGSLTEDETVQSYSKAFEISPDKARSLYASGYKRWGDLQEAIPEDLMAIPGINPTIARRIVQVMRARRY
jgi:hypothetical protein